MCFTLWQPNRSHPWAGSPLQVDWEMSGVYFVFVRLALSLGSCSKAGHPSLTVWVDTGAGGRVPAKQCGSATWGVHSVVLELSCEPAVWDLETKTCSPGVNHHCFAWPNWRTDHKFHSPEIGKSSSEMLKLMKYSKCQQNTTNGKFRI